MPITREKFPRRLTQACPELGPLVEAHVATYGEVLLPVLLEDVTPFCLTAYERHDDDVLRRCLDYLDIAIQEGDAEVESAICVSFVENVGPGAAKMAPFIAVWPDALRVEAEAQRRRA